MENQLKTCLYDYHVALGAKISPFGGFLMPIEYSSITEEHQAVRQQAGMFDVSHMGEVFISGADAEQFVNHIFTNDVRNMPVGKILYGMMLYPSGGVVDDLLVYKMQAENTFLLVINASNIEKDCEWIQQQSNGFEVRIENQSNQYGEIALQGPLSESIMTETLKLPIADLAFYTFIETSFDGESVLISRTGYTGEDGFELYGSPQLINKLWDILYKEAHVTPCGLGCRDTLRFEVGLPLYGHELNDTITPIEAGLGIFVKMDKDNFIGKESIAIQKQNGIERKLVGIELLDNAIPRADYLVEVNEEVVGKVTTGYRSISTGKDVCLALINNKYAHLGDEVNIRIRKKLFRGVVVKKRFYEKNYKK